MSKILVLGGTGQFGERICRRLAGSPDTEIIITSRSQSKADALAREIRAESRLAQVSAAALNRDAADFEDELQHLAPQVLIHTAGPFQGQDYRVARACIAARCHYIDLADGREFVTEIRSLDAAARKAGVLIVSGASTLPGLSSVVIKELQPRFSRIESIESSIAPGHQSPRGQGTVAAVLSYCGHPFKTLRDGEWRTVYGWQDLRWQHYPALGRRLSAACDVPDLSLLPEYVSGVTTVSFHAALEAPWEQLSLWIMSWLTRMRIVSDWTRHAQLFAAVGGRLMMFGSDRGGMHLRVAGIGKDGDRIAYTWYLTAERNHGPEVPCTPSIVLARKLLRGELGIRGATPALDLFSIGEFMDELSEFAVNIELVKET